jgi:hypothetical protein
MLTVLHAALLTGRLLTADHGAAAAIQVIVDWSGGRAMLGTVDTAGVDASGRFGVLTRASSDSVLIVVRGATYYTSRAMIPASRIGDELHFVLIPRRWAIEAGSFSGDTVAISPTAALRRAPDRGSFGRISFQHAVGWDASSFPLSVVLRRDDGQSITPGDSVAFWSAVRALETALGGTFFRPAMDTTLRGRAYPVDVRIDRRIPGAGITFVSWDREGNVFEASVRFHSARDMGDRGVVEHELLHVLGFGHTSEWRSAMQPRASPTQRVTATDAAYAQLLLSVHGLEEDPLVVAGLAAAQ